MKTLIRKLHKENKEILNEKSLLVAVSTGLDSMVLINYLLEVKNVYNIKRLVVAHVNHNQREQSKEEESFLKDFCKKKNLELYISSYENKSFTETLAREFRYNFFRQLKDELGLDYIATAHHYDDQAETVFMRILRGCRLLDLKSMSKVSGDLIRPLLSLSKSELPNVFHYQDHTNFENDYLRNRIRNIYIPELTKENNKFVEHLNNLSEEASNLSKLVEHFSKSIDYKDLIVFKSYPRECQMYFIQNEFSQLSVPISKGTLNDLLNILNKETNNKTIKLKRNITIRIDNNRFEIY